MIVLYILLIILLWLLRILLVLVLLICLLILLLICSLSFPCSLYFSLSFSADYHSYYFHCLSHSLSPSHDDDEVTKTQIINIVGIIMLMAKMMISVMMTMAMRTTCTNPIHELLQEVLFICPLRDSDRKSIEFPHGVHRITTGLPAGTPTGIHHQDLRYIITIIIIIIISIVIITHHHDHQRHHTPSLSPHTIIIIHHANHPHK